MSLVDDAAVRPALLVHRIGTDQIASDLFDGTLRGREAYSQRRLRCHNREPFERQGEVCATTSPDQRMNLVHYDRPHVAQPLATAGRGEQQVQRLGCSDQHVRWRAKHGSPGRRRRVARTHGRRDSWSGQAHLGGDPRDARERLREIPVNVTAEGLERRHIDNAHLVGQRSLKAFLQEVIDRDQEGCQGLARTRWGCDQCVAAFADFIPSQPLRNGWLAQRLGKPPSHGGVKKLQRLTLRVRRTFGVRHRAGKGYERRRCRGSSWTGNRSPLYRTTLMLARRARQSREAGRARRSFWERTTAGQKGARVGRPWRNA